MNDTVFMAHISSLAALITINLARKTLISLLLVDKVTILAKYLDFADIFLKKLAKALLRQTGANKHIIKFKNGK